MGKVIRNFCWHKNFVPKGLSVPALGLYTCIKSFKMCLKSYFKEVFLKLATNGQSDKGFLLTSTFVPKGLSASALGLYIWIKPLKYVYQDQVSGECLQDHWSSGLYFDYKYSKLQKILPHFKWLVSLWFSIFSVIRCCIIIILLCEKQDSFYC